MKHVALAAGIAASWIGVNAAVPLGWETDFASATNASVTAHRPLVLVWANTGCEHCEKLEESLQTPSVSSWKNESEYLFCFVLGKGGRDPLGGTKIREFAATAGGTSTTKPANYPYICLYWPKKDGSISAKSFTSDNADPLMRQADNLFAGYVPVPDYLGGDLSFTAEYAHARLEAEEGFTEYVDIPLVRDGATAGWAATNTVTATLSGVTLLEKPVAWSADTLASTVRVQIPATAKAGDTIAVTVKDADGGERGTVKIHIVAEKENSTKNPHFIGEHTADTLGYGEWTMDLDVAMEKYNKEPDSHLMAVASGSLWCPDCVMTDGHVLENPAFKAWAVENKVILVDIDVPNFPNTTNSACLLTRIVGRTSDGYISGRGTLATNELERFQSGAGYLSRHMVSDAAAAAALARNRSLVGRNTLNGGWNNPDRANQNRTGIPNFFALRRDGTLAGTFETFDAIGPSEFNEAYLKRFSELIALGASDGGDLANRSWQTTTDSFAGEGEGISATLSALDLTDTYELAATDDPADEQTITVRGADSGTTVTMTLISVIDGTAKTIATATGTLSGGVSVTGVISSTGKYYVSVKGEGSGTLAADSPASSTVTAYSMTGTRTAIENPFTNDWTAKATSTTLPLFAADGATLKGTLALTLKKNGKIQAKYSDGKKTLATFSGKWDTDIAADGTATASLAKNGFAISLVMTADGAISAEVDGGDETLASGVCGLAEDYGAFAGVYTVAMPAKDAATATQNSGNAVMTLKMATTKTARAKGLFKYTVYLPDGKKLAGSTNITWRDANFGMAPILKKSGANAFSATLKIRRNPGTAKSTRAILAADGTAALWSGTAAGTEFTRAFDVYGSWYDKGASFLTGIADETLTLAFTPDTAALAPSPTYGALVAVAGDGAKIAVTDTKMAAEKIAGFTFKVNRATGVVAGSARLSFEGKSRVAAKYTGVLLRGWFSDCDCGEDDDSLIEMQNIAFASGFCLFADRIEKKSAKRNFAIDILSAK